MDSINNACKFGSDAWLELQAFKTRQLNRREKLNRHKNLQNDLINGINLSSHQQQQQQNPLPGAVSLSSISSQPLHQVGGNGSILTTSSPASTSSSSVSFLATGPNQQHALTSKTLQQTSLQPQSVAINSNKLANELSDRDQGKLDKQINSNITTDNLSDASVVSIAVSHSTAIASNLTIKPSTSGTIKSALQTSRASIESKNSNQFSSNNSQQQQDLSTVLDRNYPINLDLVECLLLLKLCDVALKLPIDSKSLQCSLSKIRGLETTSQSLVENLLQKFAHQELITIEEPAELTNHRKRGAIGESVHNDDDDACIYVTSADHTKLVEFDKSIGSLDNIRTLLIESKTADDQQLLVQLGSVDECDLGSSSSIVPIQSIRTSSSSDDVESLRDSKQKADDNDPSIASITNCSDRYSTSTTGSSSSSSAGLHHRTTSTSLSGTNGSSKRQQQQQQDTLKGDDVESLLSLSSTRERESKKLGEELLELLSKPTAKEKNLLESFRSADGYQVQEFCPKGTKGECRRNNKGAGACDKLHFKKIIAKHTEESLGDCSFLNTCFHMDSCKYVHYEVDYDEKQQQAHQFKRPHPADPISANSTGSSGINNINSKHHQHKHHRREDSNATSSNSHSGQNICSHQKNQQKSPLDQTAVGCPPSSSSQLSLSSNNSSTICDSKDTNNNKNPPTTSISGQLLILSNNNQQQGPASSSKCPFSLSPEEQARIDAKNRKRFKTVLYPPQWIQCDLRFFDMSLLGKFSVVMADPPWDIHMELPYGTMSDDEMRKLNIPALQDEGVIFLWVTGRAMELGRECLALWGYERCDEIIWVKTNQLQRIIRTGRTGHWLNHGKEHCLVGVKGNPKDINRGLDCDVIVAEVRATSHKPDEIYGIIERLSPGTRKIELFGRAHNVQPNWITLGNQLNGVRLIEPSLVNAFKKLNLPFQTAEIK